ncbi:MAG: preprotein translocase subunit SecA [Parcubacteria group bacterium]|nr:preprotein translocase subunit SecA [Parcubacteria group bacterium]
MAILQKIFGDANARAVNRLRSVVAEINEKEEPISRLSDEELERESQMLREKIGSGEDLDAFLPPAFALVREASRRTLGQRHFDVQLLGGVALHQGKIVEMRTGEGKTLAATGPAYLNALSGKGVHVVTVNDYLARRDTAWMGQIYHMLGVSVGCLAHDASFLYDPAHGAPKEFGGGEAKKEESRDVLGGFRVFQEFLRPVSRQEAYRADVLYGTNHEFGFDFLRDNLSYRKEDLVQRPLFYAIVDEVDSILIDEARTPLIISSPEEDAAKLYREFSRLTPRFQEGVHYNIDEKMRAVTLSDEGVVLAEKLLGRKIFEEGNLVLIHHLEEALKAKILFKRDHDYIVKDGEVILVDEFTGRLMHGRRYTGGLHQALEAKEGVPIKAESRILATITLQNYFRMYTKLAGMTGTAATSAEEFHKVYGLDVVTVPTHRPMIRHDYSDRIFQTEEGKLKALVREIKERYKEGQPLLVGTISITKNERLSQVLSREGIPHEVLNAKNHEREAEIIAQAGRLGSVTVATNMAGRGVDIVLGGNPPDVAGAERVCALGGLHIIGTERHEARRIDNQLRGRSGRQGDPGSSQFFVSLEDDLMRVFGPERIKNMMSRFGIPEDEPLENQMVSKALDAAQAKIEGFNFDLRKHVLEYDDVLNKQRGMTYRRRKEILMVESLGLEEMIGDIIGQAAQKLVNMHAVHVEGETGGSDGKEIYEIMKSLMPVEPSLREEIQKRMDDTGDLTSYLENVARSHYSQRARELGEKGPETFRQILLRTIDILWVFHLEGMEHLRDSVRLRAYGQHDPLVEYKREGYRLFQELQSNFILQSFSWIFRA